MQKFFYETTLYHVLLAQVLWHENQGVTDLPPYKNLGPEIPKLCAERDTETWIWGSLQVLMLLLLPCSAPSSLKYLMVWLRV